MSDEAERRHRLAIGDPLTYEARLEAVLESISDAFYALDSEWRYVVFSRAAEEYFDVSADLILGRTLWEVFPQGRGTEFERCCRLAMEDRTATSFETFSRMRPERTVELRITPQRDGGIAVCITDVTERRQAQEGLRVALARSDEVLESISDAFYAVDGDWRFTYVNRVAEQWWGRSRDSLIGKVIWDEFPTAVGSPPQKAHFQAAETREVVRLEAFSPVLQRWVDMSLFPSGSGLSVYFRDITERKEAEERQRLLVNELNHRVKNTLATVQSIAAQSLNGHDAGDVHQRFIGRLMALAKANDVLLERDWRGATLHTIARLVASPHAGEGDAGRFVIDGPEVELSPKAATALALGLHELATNAAKYGALSSPTGRVALSWTGGDEFRLTWRESGGPAVAEPDRVGFGTRLLMRGLAYELKAEVKIDFRPDGLVCEVTAPMAALAPA